MNKTIKCAIWGAVGLGIGVVVPLSQPNYILGSGWYSLTLPGLFFGTSLGIALYGWKWYRFWTLTLAGAVGWFLGAVFTLGIISFQLNLGEFNWTILFVWGAVLGASLGVALRSWHKIAILAVTGVVGFGARWLLQNMLYDLIQLESYIDNILTSCIGWMLVGMLFGTVIGYLERDSTIN